MNNFENDIAVQNRRNGFVHASKCWETQDHHAYATSLVGTYATEFIAGIRDYANASPEVRAHALSNM